MALSEAEKARIRRYLGFSELFHDLDTRLETQMASIGTTRPDAETQVRAILTNLQAIDDKLQTAAIDNLDLVRAEDVTFLGPEQIRALQGYGRSLIQRMAITFEVEPLRDYYAAGSDFGGMIALG